MLQPLGTPIPVAFASATQSEMEWVWPIATMPLPVLWVTVQDWMTELLLATLSWRPLPEGLQRGRRADARLDVRQRLGRRSDGADGRIDGAREENAARNNQGEGGERDHGAGGGDVAGHGDGPG